MSVPVDPSPATVAFDQAAADAAITKLETVRRYLNALHAVRASSVRDPRDGWSGRFRDDFDRDFTTTQAELSGLAGTISNLIIRIEQAKIDAGRAQAAIDCKPGEPC